MMDVQTCGPCVRLALIISSRWISISNVRAPPARREGAAPRIRPRAAAGDRGGVGGGDEGGKRNRCMNEER